MNISHSFTVGSYDTRTYWGTVGDWRLAMASAQDAGLSSTNPPLSPSDRSSVRINVSGTRYAVVKQVSELLGMNIIDDEEDTDCDLLWIDTAVPLEKYMQLKSYQILNHFPGMGEICRKDSLARNIQKLRCVNNDEFNIIPMTWILPSEYGALTHFMRELKRRGKTKTFIIKPPNGAMGNGISLTRSIESIPVGESLIIQEYIEKPLLLDGYKFDLRLYVLVTACNPLRVFIYKDGLVRLSTQRYSAPTDSNLGQQFMHLTNYSINKHSQTFDKDEGFDKGSKRSLQYFNGWLIRNGYNIIELWDKIHDVIIKTLIAAQPHLQHSYQACRPGISSNDKCQCFEILGFDILIDECLKPLLLEVNRSPSFGIETKLDLHIKTGVISDALRLMNIKPTDRSRKLSLQRLASRRRLLQSSMSSRCTGGMKQPLDFAAEHEESAILLERKRVEVKSRLIEIRRNRELELHEKEFMGDYQRIYPTTEPQRQLLYESLLADSTKVGYTSRTQFQPNTVIKGLDKMREKELLELLCQYESEEKFNCIPTASDWFESHGSFSPSVQPLSFYESSPMEAELKAMAAREHEEEQTQRTMLALNTLQSSYPGKEQNDVTKIIKDIRSDWSNKRSEVGSFWLITLDNIRRRQLLNPLKESLKNLLRTLWRSRLIESIRLYKVFVRLFNFLLSNHGHGLWLTVPGGTGSDQWEKLFQKKHEVLSMSELQCCRRIIELCQGTAIAAYYYYEQSKKDKKEQQTSGGHAVRIRRRSDSMIKSVASRRASITVQLYAGASVRGKNHSVPSQKHFYHK